MSALLEQLNVNMGELVERVGQSLVRVSSGGRGFGSGSIWHPDGLIITNAHVVSAPRRRPSRGPSNPGLRVTMPDGQTHPARLLAQDPENDLAALSVDARDLTPIPLGESRNLQPGQWVTAMGHPWGVPGAATGGAVIGWGSDLPETRSQDREWIAVGLSLRPGHSGGPLVESEGRLVGICTMMAGPEVGLAVPVHVVNEFLHRELGASRDSC